jgi:hypothetical protein
VLLALAANAAGQPPAAEPPAAQITTAPAAPSPYQPGQQHEYRSIRVTQVTADPERKVNSHVEQWKAAEDDTARGKAEGELRAALKESFEFRLRRHEEQIQELEDRVKRLREQLDRRRESQDEIIDFRLQQLLREAQGLGWGTESVSPTSAGSLGGVDGGYPTPPAVRNLGGTPARSPQRR